MKAIAEKSPSDPQTENRERQGLTARPARKTPALDISPLDQSVLQRKAACACGGGCPRCHSNHFIQPKLAISTPGDPYEQEADRVAERVIKMPKPQQQRTISDGNHKRQDEQAMYGHVQTKRVEASDSVETTKPPLVHEALHSSDQPLDPTTKEFMESRFEQDFSHVRVHTNSLAAVSAQSVGARAFTVGSHLVFGPGQYEPETQAGKLLIAHELAHTIQQTTSGNYPTQEIVQRYSLEERSAMAQGSVVGQADDLAIATQRHFQAGDIVFRLGSVPLGWLTGEPVTHGGIYVGNGLIHDVVGFGNRHVRVSNFFNPALSEAADSSIYRLVRFRGPHRDLIVARLLRNISRRDFRMPTDSVPFNLFSSAGDYRTATCLEYVHAQFLYAIRQLSVDQSVSAADRQSLRRTYFTGSAAEPSPLIQPRQKRLIGSTPDMNGGRTPNALLQEASLITAATAMASDVDQTRFSNRRESQYIQHWPGGSGFLGEVVNFFMGMAYDEVVLQTFTYQSFVDSRQFFEDVPAHNIWWEN